MEIKIPERLNKDTISLLLNDVVSKNGFPLHKEYKFDFTSCTSFIEPIGVTLLHNLTRWLVSQSIEVTFVHSDIKDKKIWDNLSSPQRFLDDAGFFEKQIGEKIYPNSTLRKTTIPLEDVEIKNFNSWLSNSLIPWVANVLEKEPGELATFQVCIQEIFNNVKDHAKQGSGCIFAQHIPRKNTLIISIADIGIGIINHIKNQPQFNDFSDKKALLSSVERGFTTQTTPRNRGAGLDSLVHNMTLNANGAVYIFANSGILECSKGTNGILNEYQDANHFYPGTHIEIHINTSEASELFDIIEEEFTWQEI